MPGLYLHIPFCKKRCLYCAFYSTTLHSLQGKYVDALCNELQQRRSYIKEESISTIYFGGGTPSLLTGEQIGKILTTIRSNYAIVPDAEITIECNPDDITPPYLAMLKANGFNRISMGVQSLDNEQLQRLGRRHTAQKAKEAFALARAAGFNNISIDLMFALPGSTTAEWQHTLQSAIALQPEHISAYNLTYEDGTPLSRALQAGEITEATEEENLRQFNTLITELKKAGYRHYEISNFALPGRESRHNSSYWNDTPYLGCGAGAHSYNGTARGWNVSDINKYIKGINNREPVFEIEELTLQERYNDTVLTRLRTADGLPTEWVKERFGDTLYNYMMRAARKEIAAGNLQSTADGQLTLTEKGIFVSDAVMRELIYIE